MPSIGFAELVINQIAKLDALLAVFLLKRVKYNSIYRSVIAIAIIFFFVILLYKYRSIFAQGFTLLLAAVKAVYKQQCSSR